MRPLWILCLLASLATLIYANTFSASFHFDDFPNIVENPRIKDLAYFADFSSTRTVGFLTFALNYHFGGLSVFGYHLVNLLIHIANGFLVYWLVRLLLRASVDGRNELRPYIAFVPLAAALLFVAHPIQTQAVTYIVQRFASLVTLFYLLSVVAYLKWRMEQGRRLLWYAVSILSCALAMKTKENSFTLPLMILLMEWVFLGARVAPSSGKATWSLPLNGPSGLVRWMPLIPFLAMLLIVPLSRQDILGEAEGFAADKPDLDRWSYLFTQFRVIVTYLRLLVLPINQNLDYDYPAFHSLWAPPVFFSFLLLLSLLIVAVILVRREGPLKLFGFGIMWFFLALSVESSVIPIKDVIFEHRVYLPSAGLFLAAPLGLLCLSKRTLVGIFLVVVFILGSATYRRNTVWKDELSLWRDAVAQSPNKPRVRNSLGVAYESKGMHDSALKEYQAALRLDPNLETAHNNMGNTYVKQGALDKAIQEYQKASELKQDYASPHVNLGNVYAAQNRFEDAIREYQVAIQREPAKAAGIRNRLAVTYARLGRLDEAVREFQAALEIEPNNPEIHTNLGIAFMQQGRKDEAIGRFKRALDIDPSYKQARHVLDAALKPSTKN